MKEKGQLSSIKPLVEDTQASLTEMKLSYAKSWGDIAFYLPEGFNPHHVKFLRAYFRAQLRLMRGQEIRAKRIFAGLEKRVGYLEFEEKNKNLLAVIDLAVRGKTRWEVEPAFTVKGS